MTYGSLCTGVGGLDLAVEAVFGARMAWYAEIDKDACAVLARHWPGVPNLGDLTAVDWSTVEPVDLLCAGPPCQPVSVAGKRKGENDKRWLWPDVLRAVEALRPGWLVFENPPGIAPWLPAILRRLADLGYVGRYGRLRASDVGACHRRERVFIVANAGCWELQRRRVAGSVGSSGTADGSQARGEGDADAWNLARGSGIAPTVDAGRPGLEGRRSCEPGGRGESADADSFPWGRYRPAIERAERALGRPTPWPVVEGTRSLSGDFTEWMMMLPEGWLEGVSNTGKKRLSGNGVVPRQAVAALRELVS